MPDYAVNEEATDRLGYVAHKMVFEHTYPIHYQLDNTTGQFYVIGFRHGARLPRDGEP